jgi:hypothetical protein
MQRRLLGLMIKRMPKRFTVNGNGLIFECQSDFSYPALQGSVELDTIESGEDATKRILRRKPIF